MKLDTELTRVNSRREENERFICEQLEITSLAEIEDFPLYIQLEPTARCNSSCLMCPRGTTPARRRVLDMSDELFNRIANELALHASTIRRVIPQGFGEPLLDSKLSTRIARLKQVGIRQVYVSSNAAPLTETVAAELLASGLDQIDISIDAATKATYEVIRRGLEFEQVVANIKGFFAKRNRGGFATRVRFRFVIQERNEAEYEAFCSFWKPYLREGDAIYGKRVHTFGGHVSMPDSNEYRMLRERIRYQPCKGIFGSFYIYCDGRVPVCGVDVNQEHVAGDLNVSTIEEIWRNGLFPEYRMRQIEVGRSAFEQCPACNSWAPELKLKEVSK